MDSETQKTETLYEILGWLEVHKKQVAVGGGAVLLLAGIIATVVWYKGEQEFRAGEALSAIQLPSGPSEGSARDAVDKLQKMASDYAGTAAATRAELVRAGLLFTSGKYADAQAAFEKFTRDHPDSRWLAEAAYGVAVSLDAQNKKSDAITKYEDFTRRYATDPNVDQARLHLATLYEAGNKPAEALKEYDKIVKSMAYTPAFGEAQERQRQLLIKYPSLAPTNLPAFTPPSPRISMTNTMPAPRTNAGAAGKVPLMLRTNLLPPKPAAAPAPASAPAAAPAPPK